MNVVSVRAKKLVSITSCPFVSALFHDPVTLACIPTSVGTNVFVPTAAPPEPLKAVVSTLSILKGNSWVMRSNMALAPILSVAGYAATAIMASPYSCVYNMCITCVYIVSLLFLREALVLHGNVQYLVIPRVVHGDRALIQEVHQPLRCQRHRLLIEQGIQPG